MHHFNLNNQGRPICKIAGGKYNGRIVCIDENDAVEDELAVYKPFKSLTLGTDAKFEPYPSNRERDILAFFAPSGAGKSTLVRVFCQNYNIKHPSNNIYLFSKIKDDESLKGIKNLKVVRIDDRIYKEPLNYTDFENACVIYDDVDTISNKDYEKALLNLQRDILNCGRHSKTTFLATSHIATRGAKSKDLINESHQIVIYPSSGTTYEYLLQTYVGMSKKQYLAIKNLKSRWVNVVRSFPIVIFTEKEIMFLDNLQ